MNQFNGAWVFAAREHLAVQSFVVALAEQFDIHEPDAFRALADLRKLRVVKLDCVSGKFQLKDGRFWDGDVLRRAVDFTP